MNFKVTCIKLKIISISTIMLYQAYLHIHFCMRLILYRNVGFLSLIYIFFPVKQQGVRETARCF